MGRGGAEARVECCTAYIAFGANIGSPEKSIADALKHLEEMPIIELVASSPLYRTAPVGGPSGQPDFLNAVARVRTGLAPCELLARCLEIERRMGRRRDVRWGPRSIDLDLLLYEERVVESGDCRVPHPALRERPFVLVPLLDVAPENLALPPDGAALIDVARQALTADGEDLESFRKKRI